MEALDRIALDYGWNVADGWLIKNGEAKCIIETSRKRYRVCLLSGQILYSFPVSKPAMIAKFLEQFFFATKEA